MTPERHSFSKRKHVVVIEAVDGSSEPLELDNQSDDPRVQFLLAERTALRGWLQGYDKRRKSKSGRGLLRGRREQRDIIKSMEQEKQKKLERYHTIIGRGEHFSPIRFVKEGEEIVDWAGGEFEGPRERRWWTLVAKEIPNLYDAIQESPEVSAILRWGFDLRYKEKYAAKEEERREAIANWQGSFTEEIGSIEDNNPDLVTNVIGPLLREIGGQI